MGKHSLTIACYKHIVIAPLPPPSGLRRIFSAATEREIEHWAVRYDVWEDTLYIKGIKGAVIAQYPPGQWLRIRTTPDHIFERGVPPPLGDCPVAVVYYKHEVFIKKEDARNVRVGSHYAPPL